MVLAQLRPGIARMSGRLAIVAILLACGVPCALAEVGDTTWVTTFDHDFYNWADPHVQTFQFPPPGNWAQILLYYRIECPPAPGDCDPWDRLGHIRVITYDSSMTEVHYEIARIVTPYDITGPGYPGSCTWTLDVSHYETLLHDSVTLRSYIESWIGGNRGWIVTVRFAFIEGETELEPFRITNLWTYDYLVFGDPARPIETALAPMQVALDPEAVAFRVVATVTGHGQGNTDNAAEFARKWHEVAVGDTSYGHYLWRPNCGGNECSPQGGTWQYPRAGWCPGKEVRPWVVDITPDVTPGTLATLDYDIEPYVNFCRPTNPECVDNVTCADCDYNYEGHGEPYFCFNAQLVEFRRHASAIGEDAFAPAPAPAPSAAWVGQGSPNPFTRSVSIPYGLALGGEAIISIYTPEGRLLREIARRHDAPGAFSCVWDGRDDAGQDAAPGIYFYRVRLSGCAAAEAVPSSGRVIRLD
ncbi:MAG: hypothetical protein KBD56_01070 [Candidatus Eisenbacteria bacterium]|nr:hypothetical protein [Candidatus Eisenbacteria bacterium]